MVTRICFLFRSKANRSIGGAERSMLRLMQHTHPDVLECHVVLNSNANQALITLFNEASIPVHIATGPFKLSRTLRKLQPDVVYLFARVHVGAGWAVAARYAGIPTIVAAERGWGGGIVDRISHTLSKYFVDGFITNSTSAADYIKRAGIDDNRIFVVYNGIEETSDPVSPVPHDKPMGNPSVVCVANIWELKGQIILLQAIVQLREDYPDALAVLVGRDYTAGKFFSDAKQQHLEATYTWTGFVSDVRSYLQVASVVVLPSIMGEGVPTILLEAMQAGKPIIASRTGGISELISHDVNGLLVEPGDPDELAACLRQLLASPSRMARLGRAAQLHISEHYSVTNMVDGHLTAFKQLSKSVR